MACRVGQSAPASVFKKKRPAFNHEPEMRYLSGIDSSRTVVMVCRYCGVLPVNWHGICQGRDR